MKKELVVKDNALINASYNLELTEQRLILLAIVKARENSQGITTDSQLEIHAKDYAMRFGVSLDAAYKSLRDAVDNLFERKFSYISEYKNTGKIGSVRSRWVSRVVYVEDLAILEVTFTPDVVELITKLEERFTSYELKQIAPLSSKYGIRLYELLIAWRNTGKTPEIKLVDLRNRLGIEEHEYLVMSDFKKRVLDHSITQINTYTDITVTYEQHKAGRTITGFSFAFKVKKSQKENTPKPKGETILGVLKADIERLARAGETYEQAAERIKKQGLV